MLQENGGVIALQAGGTFCMALTAKGKLVVWGKIGQPTGERQRGGPMVAEIMGLPPIISIAAGQSHALMTDGERVWALGRCVMTSNKYICTHVCMQLICAVILCCLCNKNVQLLQRRACCFYVDSLFSTVQIAVRTSQLKLCCKPSYLPDIYLTQTWMADEQPRLL